MLIFFPFNSMLHLLDTESIEACLASVKKHLLPDGRFIIDIFNPNLGILTRNPFLSQVIDEYPDPDGRGAVVITESNYYDSASQINRIRWFYDIGNGREKFAIDYSMRIIYPQELDAVVRYNGFKIEAKYGYYDEKPFSSDSRKQIVVCN
jgi:hypothetical protein